MMEESSRISNSIKNSITSTICYVVSILIGFISQALFIKILGIEYLGLNGLFSNILTVLNIFELGIGSAIVYNLYKPIAENKIEEIKSLMYFYKKAYGIIAMLILVFGILILPFLDKFVGEITIDVNIYIIFILFLFQTVSSYLLSYKRSILYANQKNYVINLVHLCYLVIVNITKLLFLFITKNYYIYLITEIIGQLLENIIISNLANYIYPFLADGNVKQLSKNIEKDIIKKVKALFFHKIGAVVIGGTDNIIISSFFGVATVGLYSSYSMIISPVNNLFSQVITSSTASIGNLLVTESKEKIYEVFKKIRFLNFWVACFSAVSILVIIQPFITLWIGKNYLLNIFVVFIIVLNFFQTMMRNCYSAYKDSAGIWVEDKYVPLVESALNIIFSIMFLKRFGLAGVFMGTIASSLALWCYSYPKFVYKKLFDRSYIDYVKETMGYLLLFISIALITYKFSLLLIVKSILFQIVINVIICAFIPNLLMIIVFFKTSNFQYFCYLLNKMLRRGILNKYCKKEGNL